MKKLFVFLTLLSAVAIPTFAHADTIYDDVFTLVNFSTEAGVANATTKIDQFALPIGGTPSAITSFDGYGLEYDNVPYFEIILSTPGIDIDNYVFITPPPFDPNTPGLPTTTIRIYGDPHPVVRVGDDVEGQLTDTRQTFTLDDGVPNFIPGFYDRGGLPYHYLYITTDTPEPSTFVLLGTGAVGLLGAAKRRFSRSHS